MIDLSTTYLTLKLSNPLVVSASPLTADADNLKRMQEAGAAAVVLPSLFEEQIELELMGLDRYLGLQRDLLPGALRQTPDMKSYNQGLDGYLALLHRAKQALDIPVIASLNGYCQGGWLQVARLLEAVGADALELNTYYLAATPQISGAEIEQMTLNLLHNVRENVRIPIAVKLSPYFSSLADMGRRLQEAGVDGLVLFNRFYQPDFDLETESVVPTLDLSQRPELRLRLRWAAILHSFLECDLAITGGVHTAEDVIKSLMAGAKVVMMTSALYENGIDYLLQVRTGVGEWLAAHEYESVAQIRGRMSHQAVEDPAAFERANYMEVLRRYSELDQQAS